MNRRHFLSIIAATAFSPALPLPRGTHFHDQLHHHAENPDPEIEREAPLLSWLVRPGPHQTRYSTATMWPTNYPRFEWGDKEDPGSNHTQIFKTDRRIYPDRGNKFGGKEAEYLKNRIRIESYRNIEKFILFGIGGEFENETSEGLYFTRMSSGMLDFIKTNRFPVGGWTDRELKEAFKFGCPHKWLFIGSKPETSPPAYQDLRNIICPYGCLHIYRHPLMPDDPPVEIVLDPTDLKLRYFRRGGDGWYLERDNVQDPCAPYTEIEFLAEVGLQVTNEKKHAIKAPIYIFD